MKKVYIIIIVLVVLIVGILLFFGMGKKVEAPTLIDNKEINTANTNGEEIPIEESETVKEFVVTGKNFSFEPAMITVKKGDRVKITFQNTSGFHDFRIDEFGVATKQAKSPAIEVLEFTADKIGTFEYYCSVGTHRAMGMKGILKVE